MKLTSNQSAKARYEAYMHALHEAQAYRPRTSLDLGADMLALTADIEVAVLRQEVASTLGIQDSHWLGRFIRAAALRRVTWDQLWMAVKRQSSR